MLLRLWRSTFGLVAIVAIAFTLATVGIGVIAYVVTHEALEEQLDHRVSIESGALSAEAREGGLASVARTIRLRGEARSSSSLDYQIGRAHV